jgi:cell wall-associated NlpC family hydrolase
MKKIALIFSFSFLSTFIFSQVKEFDKLEMLYAQKHYKMVFRKSNRLLNNPEFDFSQLPNYYKSLSLFQLIQNELWFKRHPEALSEAVDLYIQIQKTSDGPKIIFSHINELIYLKNDINSWLDVLKNSGKTDLYTLSKNTIGGIFDKIPSLDKQGEINKKEYSSKPDPTVSKTRNDVIDFAKKQLGTPYVSGGIDNKGFDCSGFTSYVFNQYNVKLPRRALDQENKSTKVSQKNAKRGDLVFFDNGSGVSHVGIIVLNDGEKLEMIHASSSKGIIITDILQSDYWKTRIHSFGSYLD